MTTVSTMTLLRDLLYNGMWEEGWTKGGGRDRCGEEGGRLYLASNKRNGKRESALGFHFLAYLSSRICSHKDKREFKMVSCLCKKLSEEIILMRPREWSNAISFFIFILALIPIK